MQRHIVIGDIHGQLDNFIEILKHSGVIKHPTGDEILWCATDTTLVLMGDIIDRGKYSDECVHLARRLQQQAEQSSGRVVRLCGNHELFILERIFDYTNLTAPLSFRETFRKDILSGRVVASYFDGTRLFTHAGLTHSMFQKLFSHPQSITPLDISLSLNHILQDAVKICNYEHVIFDVGVDRGGLSEHGGIFWNDAATFGLQQQALGFEQVIAHSPVRKPEIELLPKHKVINVDVGICNVYGGHKAYLEISPQGTLIEHAFKSNSWQSRQLSFSN